MRQKHKDSVFENQTDKYVTSIREFLHLEVQLQIQAKYEFCF